MTLSFDAYKANRQEQSRERLIALYQEKAASLLEGITLSGANASARDVLAYVDARMHIDDPENLFNTKADKLSALKSAEAWYTEHSYQLPNELIAYRKVIEAMKDK